LQANQLQSIINLCAKKNRLAQKELYMQYYNLAMKIALPYASNYDNAVEMINDGYLKIFLDIHNFQSKNENVIISFIAWFKRVMINSCIDHIRKYKRRELMLSTSIEHIDVNHFVVIPNDNIAYKEIINFVQELPVGYRTVFNLFVIEGYGHKEIADILKISEGTSKSNLFKARQILKQKLQNNQYQNEHKQFS
jgi:RNA polymerase sigma factor (sigma-70 family)